MWNLSHLLVFAFWLFSWICLCFFLSSRSYSLTLKKTQKTKKSLLLIVNPVQPIVQIFAVPAGTEGLGSIFPFLWFHKDGVSVWATIIAQFPAHTFRALCSPQSPPGALHPFDQSVSCTEWEQIAPILFPICWPGCCMLEVRPFMVHLSSPFE